MSNVTTLEKRCICGAKPYRRMGTGPTGRRKQWSILVDGCRCGQHYPVRPEQLTSEQQSWVRRFNARAWAGFRDEQDARAPSEFARLATRGATGVPL